MATLYQLLKRNMPTITQEFLEQQRSVEAKLTKEDEEEQALEEAKK